MELQFTLNDQAVCATVHPMMPLLDVLRSEALSLGTKYGCGEGECGACTVILNGELVMACLVPACQAQGGTVETIEGLEKNGELAPIQQAFLETGGAQCGICTPGMVMAAAHYLRNPAAAPGGVREALEGNLCRCTGYAAIYRAVERAQEMQAQT